MQVTIFGASGQVGRQVTRLCLERGYTVTAVVHSHNPFESQTGLTVLEGDIYKQVDVDRALTGSQAVISALGSWHTKDKNVLASAMQCIVPSMQTAGLRRIVTVTGSAALSNGDKPNLLQRLLHTALGLAAPKILRDGEAHLALLAASQLDWTCIRSSPMTKQSKAGYSLGMHLSLGLKPIPRLAVATAMVDQLERQDFLKQAPVIYGR